MARTVSRPCNATAVAYTHLEYEDEYDDWTFDNFVEWFKDTCKEHWPSLEEPNKSTWIGREDHVLLENAHAQIGISEYMGLVAVWIVPVNDDWYYEHNGLHDHWCAQIEPKFEELFGTLRKIGTFSNGEAVFERRRVSN